MSSRIARSILLLILLQFVVVEIAFAQNEIQVTTRSTLNLRAGPGTNFEVLAKIPPSTNVPANARNQDSSWLRVNYNNLVGWLSVQYLIVNGDASTLPVSGDTVPLSAPSDGVTATNPSTINIRAEPSSSASKLGQLRARSTVTLTGRSGSGDDLWVRFTFEGRDAWLAARLLKINGDVNSLPEVPPTPGDPGLYFNIYTDYTARDNHFVPSGWMADIGDISINQSWSNNCHGGDTCIQATYNPQGRGPNECNYSPPCKWGGVYWVQRGWGETPDVGFNLTGFTKLTFWTRSDNPNMFVEFKTGGITGPYPDSLQPARSTGFIKLPSQWTQFQIDLRGADLSYINGGFVWVTNWANANGGGNFYLDDIRFEK